jgi:hypothetical protein
LDWKIWRIRVALFLDLLFLVYCWTGAGKLLFITARNPHDNNVQHGAPGLFEELTGDELAALRDAGGSSSALSGTVVGLLLTSLGAALVFYFLNNPGALEKLLQWWKKLPERAALRLRQAQQAVHGFLAAVRRAWLAYPGNLHRSWRQLSADWRALPGLLGAAAVRVCRGGVRLMAAVRLFLKRLPGNLQWAWQLFLRESKAFPAWLGRLAMRADRAMRRGAARLCCTLKSSRASARDNLAAAWSQAAEALQRWGGAIREAFKLLRRRIGP